MSDQCCPGPVPESENAPSPMNAGFPPSVAGTVETPAGPVPRVTARFTLGDRLGIWKVRWGIGRMRYKVPPGLYALGEPEAGSEVLVTANYRMTFDLLRRSLQGLDVWILVLDTAGINVWCAAGKGTFGTEELAARVASSRLSDVVNHRRLILPQLGAAGVAAHELRRVSGFRVVYGPVMAADIPAFLAQDRRATPSMRRKRFPLSERAALIPMELVPTAKVVLPICLGLALTAGLAGGGDFVSDAWRYGMQSLALLALGTASGAVLTPLLLPWIPGRAFALKGAVTGAAAALLASALGVAAGLALAAWALILVSLSSFLAMNFTGSSTFTSLSGVRREMRFAVPAQIAAASIGLVLWVGSLFLSRGGGV